VARRRFAQRACDRPRELKKAAGTALIAVRYVDRPALLKRLSRLAREELRHFEQVVDGLGRAGIEYVHLKPGRYAGELKGLVRTSEPGRLIDTLLVGAIVEARSCERFEKLGERFDDTQGALYRRLQKSEARHFGDYLALAERYDDGSIGARLQALLDRERWLIESPDVDFRFHSGVPATRV
jgi:tRNA-(ms[2]io[6]A)-hydroxylase